MKGFGVFALIVLTIPNLASSVSVVCNYSPNATWIFKTGIYECHVGNAISITTSAQAEITSNSGTHLSGRNNDHVLHIHFSAKTIYYFPRGIEKVFRNIQGIGLDTSKLRYVTQSDLRPLINLVHLNFWKNEISVIEEGLLDYNTKLKFINLGDNRVTRVHWDVFINLNSLVYLWFNNNACLNAYANNDFNAVQKVIQQIRFNCPSPASTRCPATCSSETSNLSNSFNSFRTSTNQRLQTIDNSISSLTTANSNTVTRINNLDQRVTNDIQQVRREIQQLNSTLTNQIRGIENSMQSSFNNMQNDLIQTEVRVNKNIENAIKDLGDELKTSQDEAIKEVRDEMIEIDEKLEDFMYETIVRLHKIEISLFTEIEKVEEKINEVLNAINGRA